MLDLDLFRQHLILNCFSERHIPNSYCGENKKVALQKQTITQFPIFRSGSICSFAFPEQERSPLHTYNIIHNTLPFYIFLKTQIRIKLVKLTMQWPKSSLWSASLMLCLNLLRVNASAIAHMVKYAICACQSMSEFWVNPHEYVTLSAWINKNLLTG